MYTKNIIDVADGDKLFAKNLKEKLEGFGIKVMFGDLDANPFFRCLTGPTPYAPATVALWLCKVHGMAPYNHLPIYMDVMPGRTRGYKCLRLYVFFPGFGIRDLCNDDMYDETGASILLALRSFIAALRY